MTEEFCYSWKNIENKRTVLCMLLYTKAYKGTYRGKFERPKKMRMRTAKKSTFCKSDSMSSMYMGEWEKLQESSRGNVEKLVDNAGQLIVDREDIKKYVEKLFF